jgi:hypothetical protein
MRAVRPALALALAGVAASSAFAFGADAPKTTATSLSLFMAQEGCGTTAEAGRLEPKPQGDSADGCGTIGGLPANEVFHQDEEDFGAIGDDYTSTAKLVPFMIDATKKVTGQVAAGSGVGGGAGGLGTVTWDVTMTAFTTSGKLINFGSTTVNAPAAPGQDEVTAAYELAVPAAAAGQTIKKIVINVAQRGQNLLMSSKQLSGESYVVLPVKPKPVRKRR